jgi:hypothetical protein
MPDRQRRRFYDGIYQAEIDGALWTFGGEMPAEIRQDESRAGQPGRIVGFSGAVTHPSRTRR